MEIKEILSYATQLDSPFKDVLHLYYQEKLTQNEITERMGISRYKAKGYISKALYLVKKLSGDKGLENARKILYGPNPKPAINS